MNDYEKTDEEAEQLGQETGAKFDGGKSRWDLIPADVLLEIANEDTTIKGLYEVENRIDDVGGKMMFHYSNGMEAAWNFWSRKNEVPMTAGTKNPLVFASISFMHLLDLCFMWECDDNDGLSERTKLHELEIPNVGGFYMMPYKVLNCLGDIYLYGCKKYDENNWRKGMPFGRLFGAFCRHSGQWHGGESYDEESGMHHIGHALWQLLGLRWFEQYKKDLDDRWINPPTS
jgi:hypothetical protein